MTIRTGLRRKQITISLDLDTDKHLTTISKSKGQAKSRVIRHVVEDFTNYHINQKKGDI
jgi:hypothetical protein